MKNILKQTAWLLLVAGSVLPKLHAQAETLSPLENDRVPETFDELWADFDPRAEPLDIEVLKEWREDGVVMQVLRYRIGVFKGQKSMMAAVYGYPKQGSDLPGLVQIHGGGQYADYRAVLTNAKRGYATISISWAGRINAPGYQVNPEIVRLFWEGKTGDPKYKLTTDWGTLDAYHAPCRSESNGFVSVAPTSWTLDAVESPRNNSWFLCTLGARRALTFLEQQPEVNAERLGVYGHSMGGKLTVMTTAADSRVKASAPSCGGISDRTSDNLLYRATINDDVSLRRISCPIMFLSPANDFHGRIDDLQKAVREIKSDNWRLTCSAHHNHQDNAEAEVATQLWFDQHLKGVFSFPETPTSSLSLNTKSGVPSLTVRPECSLPILDVDIYYTQHGQVDGERDDRNNTMNRFWHHARVARRDDTWTADLPLLSADRPLWAYANVVYALDQPVIGAGYYYRTYIADKFNLSSLMHTATSEQLKAAGIQATLKPSLLIETFDADWDKEWFTYRPKNWGRRTHKVYDERWKAPVGAKLAFEVRSAMPNRLVVGIDEYAAEVHLAGHSEWERIVLTPGDFRNSAGAATLKWTGIKELRLDAKETLRSRNNGKEQKLTFGANWEGAEPEFRNLRWITE